MTPVHCRIEHDPPETYGDCLRACIASVMDMEPENVPHFYFDGCDGETGLQRADEWLVERGFRGFRMFLDGEGTAEEILAMGEKFNPDALYLLFGTTASGGAHVVVCRGGAIEHDPAWVKSPMVGPSMTVDNEPVWMVMAICRN